MNGQTLLLLALAGWSSAVGVATLHGSGAQDPAPKRFSHAQHVGQIWFNLQVDEVWRDCRGCHRFDAQNLVSAPQRECDGCHLPGNLGKDGFLDGWKDDLGGYATATRDAFRHHTHGMLECRECHLPVSLVKLSDFDIITGAGQCARCHDPALASRNDFAELKAMRWFRGAQDPATAAALGMAPFTPPAPAEYPQYVDTLARAFAGPTGGINTTPLPVGGDFDHHDHAELSCVTCHGNIPGAGIDGTGTGTIPLADCGRCHLIDARGTPARAAPGPKLAPRPLWSLGAFAHADHYRFLQPGGQRKPGVATEAAYELLARAGAASCTVCHTQDPAGIGTAERDFPFATGKSRHQYLDCIVCHDVPGWRTGETPSLPLHDSVDGKVDGRSGWNECARCHDFGAADFAASRPRVDVARQTERVFQFTTHTHPDITTPGIARSGRPELQDCRTCHRARVPELPSRIERRPFRHDTHLPAQPSAQDCQQCHPTAANAADAAALGGADGRTYSLQSCAQCHWGGPVQEIDLPAVAPRRAVVAFPHGPHLAAGAACADCHEPAPGGRDYATKPQALDCTQCHDHKAGGPKTERLFDDEVKSCVHCHHDAGTARSRTLVIPARRGTPAAAADPRYQRSQTAFAGFADSQFHPLGKACTECHRAVLAPDARWPGLRVPRQDHLFATSRSPHAGATNKEPAECLRCHWKPMDGGRYEAGVVFGDAELLELRKRPSSPATRARFGNDPRGYPGTAQAGG